MIFNEKKPSFIIVLDKIINEILSSVNISEYFNLNDAKKLTLQNVCYNIIKKTINKNVKLSDEDFNKFMKVLQKKNEQAEHYEIAQILNDIVKNYSTIKHNNNKTKKVNNNG